MSLTEYSKNHLPVYPEFVEIRNVHEAIHWITAEVNLAADVEQWKTRATEAEKNLIKNILRLFTTSDFVVGAGYLDRLIPHIKNNEARGMLTSFANREFEHTYAYALLSDTLGFGDDFYFEFLEYGEMSEKVEFMVEPSGDSPEEFAKYLARQTLIEGVNLFASFAVLLNFDRFGLFPGMVDVVRWSLRDEGVHCEGNSLLFKRYIEEHPYIVDDNFKRDIYDLARELVRLEDVFIDKCYEMGEVQGLKPAELKQYIRFIADNRLQRLGFKRNWDIEENPIPWIDALQRDAMGNFFERSVAEYQKDNLKGEWEY